MLQYLRYVIPSHRSATEQGRTSKDDEMIFSFDEIQSNDAWVILVNSGVWMAVHASHSPHLCFILKEGPTAFEYNSVPKDVIQKIDLYYALEEF